MTALAQIVDEADVVLFDLNDPTGAANPGSVKTGVLHNADLGSIPTERDFFNPTASPGSLLVHKRHGLVVTRFGVLMRASSSDDLLTGVRELGRLLDGPGIVKWQPNGASVATYFDYEDGDIPTLLRGQDLAQQKAFLNYLDTELPVVFHRHPYLRRARQTVAPVAVSNDPLTAGSRFIEVNNPGSAPAPLDLTLSPTAGSVQEVLVAIAPKGGLEGATLVLQGEDANLTGAVGTVVADANASGGNTLNFAGAVSSPRPLRYLGRWVLAGAVVPKGRFRLTARLRSTTVQSWMIQPRYAPFDAGTQQTPHALPEVPFNENVNGAATFSFTEAALGVIEIPDDAEGFTLDLWARQNGSGTGHNLRFDFLALVPYDTSSILTARPQGAMNTLGKNLTGLIGSPVPSVNGDDMVMTADDNTARLSITPRAGRWRVTWTYSFTDPHSGDRIRWKVVRDPSGTPVTVFQSDLNNVATELHRKTFSGEFDANGTNAFNLDLIYEIKGVSSAGVISVHSVTLEYISPAVTSESFRTEPENRRARKFSTTGVSQQGLDVAGSIPLWAEPGDSYLFVIPLDVRGDGLSPFLTSVLGRTLNVGYEFAPREF